MFKNLLLFLLTLLFFTKSHATIPKPVALKCEYLVNPIGIDAVHPRFTWQMDDNRQHAKQTAFQITIGTDSGEVSHGIGNCWQTAKIDSSTNLITYQGKPLQPYTKYYWGLRLWDQDGHPDEIVIANFETGLMTMNNWKGNWISDDNNVDIKPAAYFRKVFNTDKKIISARAYIAVAGLYELYINGKRVGDHRLDPMYTRFDRRNLYVSYDVTAAVQPGKNAIGVLLGNGWYNFQSIGVWDFERAPWRARPTFCLDLRITYDDGSIETIASDKSWKTSLSPLTYNSIYTGERYDDNLEQPGWDKPYFDDSKWNDVVNRQAPSQNIVSQALQPIRYVEKLKPVSMHCRLNVTISLLILGGSGCLFAIISIVYLLYYFRDRKKKKRLYYFLGSGLICIMCCFIIFLTRANYTAYIFDFGRNIAGVTQIKLKGEQGTEIRVVHAEKLYKNGFPDQSNVDYFLSKPTRANDPFGTDIYTLNGRGEETFVPRFNYKGFQYVEVTSNKPINLTKENILAYFMHSDVAPAGNVTASSTLINKIWKATNSSYLSNLFGYPTDCPQREKNGWTGDAHIASETGLYNFDGITIYEKWMADHRDEQQPNGVLPSIVPTDGWGYEWGNGPDWTSTIAIIPWNVYLFYGDSKLLNDCYGNIQRYVDHINDLYPTGLTTWGLGDWAPVKSKTPVELTSSIYYYTDVSILAKAAKLFGKTDDYARYDALANKIRDAINAKYLNPETGVYAEGHQTEQAVPLYWGIVPDSLKNKAAAILADSVAADNYHLDVGILGAKAILGALSDNGQAQTAYRLATQDTFPSWGWWIVNGATTLYENWNINLKRDLSLNHIMFGEISAWMYKTPGGIKPDETQPGFKHILLKPSFVTGLGHFEAKHTGPYGEIVSSWTRKGKVIIYNVTVPANSTATIWFPAGKKVSETQLGTITNSKCEIDAGSYEFRID